MITVSHAGLDHPMFRCTPCLALKWKAYRTRFLHQFLWVILYGENKEKNKFPPSVRISTRLLTENIIELQGKEEYTVMMNDASQSYKNTNSQVQIPLDLSSSLSVLEDSSNTQSVKGGGGEGGAGSCPLFESSSTEKSPSHDQTDQASVTMNISSRGQHFSPDRQKNDMVIQMDREAQETAQAIGLDRRCDINVHSESLRYRSKSLQTYLVGK